MMKLRSLFMTIATMTLLPVLAYVGNPLHAAESGSTSGAKKERTAQEAAALLHEAALVLGTPELRRTPEVREAMRTLERALESAHEAASIYSDNLAGNRNRGSSGLRGGSAFGDPWDPISGIQQMRAMQERMMQQMLQPPPAAQRRPGTGTGPSVDMKETPEAFVVTARLPGVEASNLKIDITESAVRLSGTQRRTVETQDPTGLVQRSENVTSFSNTVGLPGPVDAGRATTTREGDVVTITIPRVSQQGQATMPNSSAFLEPVIIQK